jgi:hypothetical protein
MCNTFSSSKTLATPLKVHMHKIFNSLLFFLSHSETCGRSKHDSYDSTSLLLNRYGSSLYTETVQGCQGTPNWFDHQPGV